MGDRSGGTVPAHVAKTRGCGRFGIVAPPMVIPALAAVFLAAGDPHLPPFPAATATAAAATPIVAVTAPVAAATPVAAPSAITPPPSSISRDVLLGADRNAATAALEAVSLQGG